MAGERLYDYRAVDALVGYMETRGLNYEFSDGSSGRAALYRWLTETIKRQSEVLREATDKWRRSAPKPEDPNLNDPVLILKLRAIMGVDVAVGAELTNEQEATIRLKLLERREAREKRRADRLAESIMKRHEEYAQRNSPETLLAKEVARRQWYDLLDFADVACKEVKSAILSGCVRLASFESRPRAGLNHERLKQKPHAAAALHRALGHIEEFRGHLNNAAAFYTAALDLDPGVGCKRNLERVKKRD